ncbi:hypothetical protein CMK18_20790 [Candidatus Poribacteria bacterium]|nr:hypothetical protein [Candidatus Poribacteria bacterium]
MDNFLKGNYKVKKEIADDGKNIENEFKEKAINSIGGSMVFVERDKMVWVGPENSKTIKKDKNNQVDDKASTPKMNNNQK